MLELRPIVVDENFVVLGGNMRLKALKDLGIKETFYIQQKDLTDEQKKQFVIKDNASFGDWDWDILANEWNNKDLLDWGIDVWQPEEEEEKEIEKDAFADQIDTYINAQIKQIVLYYNNEEYETALNNLEEIRLKENLEDNTQVFNFLIEKYLKNEL
tara:strand:- start:2797 stop:3267 length:471 start_codon:yes stop_codon:yes gene_type:complete